MGNKNLKAESVSEVIPVNLSNEIEIISLNLLEELNDVVEVLSQTLEPVLHSQGSSVGNIGGDPLNSGCSHLTSMAKKNNDILRDIILKIRTLTDSVDL